MQIRILFPFVFYLLTVKLFLFFLYFMCMGFVCMHVYYAPCAMSDACGGQERASDFLGLKLWTDGFKLPCRSWGELNLDPLQEQPGLLSHPSSTLCFFSLDPDR